MMSLAAIVLIASVIIFALIGVPLVWSLVLASVCSVAAGGTLNALPILAQRMFAGGLQYSMLAIFFFVLAGAIMQYGGLSRRLVAFANSLVGHISGGASLVCVMACAFFAAISGSAVATTAAIGGIMYPELKRLGYPEDYAAALPAAAGVLGVIIPPSVLFIIYAILPMYLRVNFLWQELFQVCLVHYLCVLFVIFWLRSETIQKMKALF